MRALGTLAVGTLLLCALSCEPRCKFSGITYINAQGARLGPQDSTDWCSGVSPGPVPPTPARALDVPENTTRVGYSFEAWNNPSYDGTVVFSFSLASRCRVQIQLVGSKCLVVRTLADRTFEAGPQQVRWDGTDDSGRPLPRGIYRAFMSAGAFSCFGDVQLAR